MLTARTNVRASLDRTNKDISFLRPASKRYALKVDVGSPFPCHPLRPELLTLNE